MKLLLQIWYLQLLIVNAGYAAKILGIFPMPARSHYSTSNAVMKSLIGAGHQVTLVTPFPKRAASENYTSIIDSSDGEFIYVSQSSFQDFAQLSLREMVKTLHEWEKSHCKKVLNLPQIRKILNSDEKLFDVMFVEILMDYKCYFYIAEKLKIPVIGTTAGRTMTTADNAIGNPCPLAYVPHEMSFTWKSADDFYSRLRNVFDSVWVKTCMHFMTSSFLAQFHQENVGISGPDAKFLEMEPSLVFYNSHASYLPRPLVPNAIDIGGISLSKAKPLPENLKKFIDEAEHGVILFSLGSVTRAALLPAQILDAFREAFAEIPQRVIWKFEEKMENVSSNVRLIEWLPQRDILEHKNVKAFIGHCGQASTYEAIQTATPLIAIPLFGDQPSNAAILDGLGVAFLLDINNLSKEIILDALHSIINDTRYNDNMQKLSKSFKDRPMTPQQSVVYWTEYVIRHNGAPHLKTAATTLNWFQYFLLDVLGFLALLSILMLYLTFRVVKTLNFYFHRVMTKYGKDYKNKAL